MDLGYNLARLKAKILRKKGYASGEIVNQYFRKKGVEIGERCLIYTNIVTNEPYLIKLKNDVVISTEVCFVTHDYSIHSVCPSIGNLFGNIVIGNNCFIGERAILMYGVELADNIIVAAGSVVTKSFYDNNIIIGGNPARIIGNWDNLYITGQKYGYEYPITKEYCENHPEKMVRRKSFK